MASPKDPASGAVNELVDPATIARWVLAIGSVWVVLTLGVDIGATRDLAVAFALLFMGAVLIIHGPTALTNLGFPVGG